MLQVLRSAKRFEENTDPLREVWQAVWLRSSDAGRPGLPGIAAETSRARSHVGAVGVMQLMPGTGKENGSRKNIGVTESNIHAGTKYMDRLMTRYFQDAHFDDTNRALFAFASYKRGGPPILPGCAREATARGLDRDKWFNNVEIVVAEKIGIETTTYVRNIYKYYAALPLDRRCAAKRATRAIRNMRPGGLIVAGAQPTSECPMVPRARMTYMAAS